MRKLHFTCLISRNIQWCVFWSLASLLLALSCSSFCLAADKLQVSSRGTYDVKNISLESGQLGSIEVHLMSAGDTVDGYQVSLFRDSDAELIDTQISDEHGIVHFYMLQPNTYTLILRRSITMKRESTVRIGDFFLSSVVKHLNVSSSADQ